MQNNEEIYTSAVVVAAGSGSRMKTKEKKQFIKIAGIPMLARTLLAFENSDLINEIVLVAAEEDITYCKRKIIGKYKLLKVKEVVAGGDIRQDSVFNGLLETSAFADLVLIQDGARPFTDEGTIKRCIDAAVEYGAAIPAIKVKDTVKKADEEGFVIETVDRSDLWSVQTPQVFKRDIIIDAHIRAAKEVTYTDDAMMAESLGIRVKISEGSSDNIKVTTQDDLIVAETIAAHIDQTNEG